MPNRQETCVFRQFAILFSGQYRHTLIGMSPGHRPFCAGFLGPPRLTNNKNRTAASTCGSRARPASFVLYPKGIKLKLAMDATQYRVACLLARLRFFLSYKTPKERIRQDTEQRRIDRFLTSKPSPPGRALPDPSIPLADTLQLHKRVMSFLRFLVVPDCSTAFTAMINAWRHKPANDSFS